MRKALLSLFAIAAFTSSAAIAAPQVTIDFNNPIWGTGSSKIDPILATIHFPNSSNPDLTQSTRVNAGRFVGTASNFVNVSPEIFYKNENEVYMYCYDVYNHITGGDTVVYDIDFEGATKRTLQFIDAVNRVLSGDGDYNPYAWVTPTNRLQAGAIQLGLWESLYDTDWSLTTNTGKFYTTNVTAGVIAQANTFFASIDEDSAIDQKFTMVLRNASRQDMITADPPVNGVPTPATLLLMLPALAGLAISTRRRRQA